MKRTGAVIRLIVWLLTAMILSSLLMAGLAWDGGFSSFGIGSVSYKDADDYLIGDSEVGIPTDGINEIEINWVSGTVTVQKYGGSRISVSERGARDSDTTFRYLVRDGKLTIQFAKSKLFGFNLNTSKDLTLMLPENMSELTKLDLNVVSSDTSLTKISAHEIEFQSVSGNLHAEDVVCSKLDADTVSGDVSFTHGPHLIGAISRFEMDTVSGNTTLKTPSAPDTVNCDSISGDVTLAFASCDGFTATFDKLSGDFDCDFPVTEEKDRKIYGDGSSKFSFDTVSGDIRIEQLAGDEK